MNLEWPVSFSYSRLVVMGTMKNTALLSEQNSMHHLIQALIVGAVRSLSILNSWISLVIGSLQDKKQSNYRMECGGLIGRFMPFIRRVMGSNPALAATRKESRDLGQDLHSQLPVALRHETSTQYQCCSQEHLWVIADLKRCYRNSLNESVGLFKAKKFGCSRNCPIIGPYWQFTHPPSPKDHTLKELL